MGTDAHFDAIAGFRIGPKISIVTGESTPSIDTNVKKHLDELNKLLGGKIFKPAARGAKEFWELPLTPKYDPAQGTANLEWDGTSLLGCYHNVTDGTSIAYEIGRDGKSSGLKYQFQTYLAKNLNTLSPEVRAVLSGYGDIVDYLIFCAYKRGNVSDINALISFILTDKNGIIKDVIDYAAVSAARTFVAEQHIQVPTPCDDTGEFTKEIKKSTLTLSSATFKADIKKIIDRLVFWSKEEAIITEQIKKENIDDLSNNERALLISYMKNSPVKVTKTNADHWLPLFLMQMKRATTEVDTTEVDALESAKAYDVEFPKDDNSLLQVSVDNVKCAAQLFYAMTLGDELNVFSVADYFTRRYLLRDGLSITDGRLRENLQMYAFSHKFVDAKTGRILDRTRPEERQMFYKQVFNYGSGPVPDDVVVNDDFIRLWKLLMLESAKYIERAQESPNPDTLVPRQNVVQAVEDIQYNLSCHCTGMANIITPIIYSELMFVIEKILKHREIINQVVPAGGTWWRVVERLHAAMKSNLPKANILNNKAKYGYDILRSIAEYTPGTFEDSDEFGELVGTVDAFITTQGALQESLTDDLIGINKEQETPALTDGSEEPAAKAVVAQGQDEWDF